MEIPIVDFSDCGIEKTFVKAERLKEVGADVFNALAKVGFVYLDKTGIPRSDIEEAFRISKLFFELPEEVKGKFKYDKNYSGYHGICRERTNPDRPNDFKESFHLAGMALALQGSTWPDNVVPGFSTVLGKMFEHCRSLSFKLLEALAYGMNLQDKEYFLRSHSRIGGEQNYTTLRTLHYPPLPKENLLPGQLRLGEHTDYGSFTLLFQGDIGGLEIERYDGNYVEAKPIPGTVLVNIGDLLQFWSGGRLKSTTHRIRNPVDDAQCLQSRHSLVCFVHPNYETKIEELSFDENAADSMPRHNQSSVENGKCITAVEWAEMRYSRAYR